MPQKNINAVKDKILHTYLEIKTWEINNTAFDTYITLVYNFQLYPLRIFALTTRQRYIFILNY